MDAYYDTDTCKLTKKRLGMPFYPDRIRGHRPVMTLSTPRRRSVPEAGKKITPALVI